jgi:2-polyprenyl-3-methyl-5-hydroxy-6-metoxy-1,4-benzoquinol methylase
MSATSGDEVTFEFKYLDACPECRSTRIRPFAYSISPGATHCAQSRCRECTLVFANPQLLPRSLSKYYGSSYWESHWTHQLTTDSAKAEADVAIQRPEAARIAALAKGGRLLEIGSGSGALLAALRERGFEVHGLEPSRAAAERSRVCYGLTDVTTGTVDEVELPVAAFDVIVAWHVIEHVTDLGEFLRTVRRALRPGGLFYLGTETYENAGYAAVWLSEVLRLRPAPFATSCDHTFAFTKRTLSAALERGGFAVEMLECYQPSWGEKMSTMSFRNPLGRAWFYALHATNRAFDTGPLVRAACRAPSRSSGEPAA